MPPSDDQNDVPAIEVTSRATVRRVAVDAIAKARYLEVLSRTGSRAAAASAARPHLHSRRSAMATMEAHIATHPEFASQVADIETSTFGKLEEAIVDRALNGQVEYRKLDPEGRVVEERIKYDNELLLKVTRQVGKRIDPNAWAPEDKRVIVSGGTNNVTTVIDVDKMLEGMSSESIRQMLSGLANGKTLGPGEEPVDDAEIVESAQIT